MSVVKTIIEFITFPIRGVTLIDTDRFGLSSLRTERFNYVSKEVRGKCLDIGCGRDNTFVTRHLNGNGVGIDVYPYAGLKRENIVKDMTSLPFKNGLFSAVTFIACLNHVPENKRLAELAEAYRCLKVGGKVIITMGNPVAEIVVHKLLFFYDKFLHTHVDVDTERGMVAGEEYFLTDGQIIRLLMQAGFTNIQKKYFPTQWCLNHLFTATKPI
jgi:SAM-dependent methyltransferase